MSRHLRIDRKRSNVDGIALTLAALVAAAWHVAHRLPRAAETCLSPFVKRLERPGESTSTCSALTLMPRTTTSWPSST